MLYPIQNDIRNKLDISGIWDFQVDPEETGEKDGWFNGLPAPRPLAVPGSWNEQYEDLYNYFGLGWYVKRTYIPAGWKSQRVFIRVGSANYCGTVYVNGIKIGVHEGGHLPFEFDITDRGKWNTENIIAISVENHLTPTRVPSGNLGSSLETGNNTTGYPSSTVDFFPFAGIHRPVVLYSVPHVHLTDVTVVTEIDGENARVKVTAQINGKQDKGRLILAGEKPVEVPVGFKDGLTEAVLSVPSARLWSDKDPYLYDLTIVTSADKYTFKVGIRTIAVRDKQILLNGQPIQLKGYGRHEDFIASGKGLNLPLLVKDYALMRWTGANSYRTSHYPYSEEEMQMADREGFLIIDETPNASLQFENLENMAERKRVSLRFVDELIARDKNHPSVIMWSVANEPTPADSMARYTGGAVDTERDAASAAFLNDLLARARQRDATRPVTLTGLMGAPAEWLANCDVICINRYWGWYVMQGQLDKACAMLDQELDDTWEMFGKPVIVSEFGAEAQPGLHGNPALMWTEEYQAAFIRGYLEVGARKDFVIGMHIWNFADFAAIQSVMRVGGQNMKGVFTRTRQPKMAAHVLRDKWTRSTAPAETTPQTVSAPEQIPAGTDAPNLAPAMDEIHAALTNLAARLDGKKPDLTATLKFDFHADGIYRLIIERGACRVVHGDGDSAGTLILKWSDAQKLFAGKLDPMVAVMTGKIKTKGDARLFLVLQEV
jgi:beta-glucuronidase